MVGSRIPGPLGIGPASPPIDDGTLALTNSPLPGPLGIGTPSNYFSELCTGIDPQLTLREEATLRALLQQYPGDEVLALGELMETLPTGEDSLKAFAGGLLGASRARGKGYIQALQAYNDSLVQWKNAPKKQRNKIKTEKVQPAHERLNSAYRSELRSMARWGSPALKSPRQGMRVLRSRQHTIDLTGSRDVWRLKSLLKIARMGAYGSIIIDARLVGQKVQDARDAGGNAEKVAYEEYGALVGGIALAGAVTMFFGPGLIILTLVGGVSALVGAGGGRELGKWMYEQISAYEAAIPPERKKQLMSEMY
ncbi:MAG: hypothetical protein L3J88_14305 [Gammaproteobacteria bacterium]|nr:hypothetical protein [Gammaproteobacteria bacterium]MCF6364485.1 hypothetical protein [Gammaproteobacteria bacterium]